MRGGRQEAVCGSHALPLTFGMDMWSRGMSGCQRLMRCLTVGMPRIFMRRSSSGIRSIAGNCRQPEKRVQEKRGKEKEA